MIQNSRKNGQSRLEGRTRFSHSMNTRPKQIILKEDIMPAITLFNKTGSWVVAKSLTGTAEALVASTGQSSVTRYIDHCGTANRSTGVMNAQSIEQLVKYKDG